MAIRRPIVTVLGHVDHGKSSILDRIRGTAVVAREAGGITQAIGCSIVPIKTIQTVCGSLLDSLKSTLTIPGLLFIDSPGHAAFISLRKRGGSLADLAVLVVDINEGFRPQTAESIEILKVNKVPFVIAANKIDLLNGWKYDPKKFSLDNINSLSYEIQGNFEKKMYELVAQAAEHGMQAERFDRVSDYTKQVAIVPVSAFTGQGIPELLMILTGLAQKYLEKKLEIDEHGHCRGTVLELKEEKGLGTTIDCIIYNGKLRVNDIIIVGSLEKPIVTKVRALLEPVELAEMREKKSRFKNVKEVTAATGVKIAAPELENAVAGMPLRSCPNDPEEIERVKAEVQQELTEVMSFLESENGVMVKADTIGGLEALRHMLEEKNIPVASVSLGDPTKRDLSTLESLKEKDEFTGVLLGFNVSVSADLADYAKAKGLRLITNEVIYKIIEDYEKYVSGLKKEIEIRELSNLVRPCKFLILKGYVFRQSNPAIVGVEIEAGKIRAGDPILRADGARISTVKSMGQEQESLNTADQGKQVAMAMDNVTVGRQVKEGDYLYTDVPEEDFKRLKELKKHLSKRELEVLREIVEIKRKENPVWGVGNAKTEYP